MKIESVRYCKNCKRDTIHFGNRHKFNTGLHIFMTLITGLFWLVPFFFYYLSKRNTSDKWHCRDCREK